MNTLEAIAKRKSTRNYKPEQIPEEALQTILQAGSAAPVAMAKYDSLHITVVQDQKLLDRINKATEEVFFQMLGVRRNMDFGAKTLLFVSSKEVHRPGTDHANAGIVMENMVLAATALGIDSVILGGCACRCCQGWEADERAGYSGGLPASAWLLLGLWRREYARKRTQYFFQSGIKKGVHSTPFFNGCFVSY